MEGLMNPQNPKILSENCCSGSKGLSKSRWSLDKGNNCLSESLCFSSESVTAKLNWIWLTFGIGPVELQQMSQWDSGLHIPQFRHSLVKLNACVYPTLMTAIVKVYPVTNIRPIMATCSLLISASPAFLPTCIGRASSWESALICVDDIVAPEATISSVASAQLDFFSAFSLQRMR